MSPGRGPDWLDLTVLMLAGAALGVVIGFIWWIAW